MLMVLCLHFCFADISIEEMEAFNASFETSAFSNKLNALSAPAAPVAAAPSKPTSAPRLRPAVTSVAKPIPFQRVDDDVAVLTHSTYANAIDTSFDDVDLNSELKTHFGFDDFLPGQEFVIRRILQSQNSLLILPTGGGKSLWYSFESL
jgi:superfamily II DNA helicase RecQ